MTLNELRLKLSGLVIFRGLLSDPVIASMRELIELACAAEAAEEDENSEASLYGGFGYSDAELAETYAVFCENLFAKEDNWTQYLLNAVLQNDNMYVRRSCTENGAGKRLEACLNAELETLNALAAVTGASLKGDAEALQFLPEWETEEMDLGEAFLKRMQEVRHTGYGVFARHHVFTIEQGQLVPVRFPDPQKLSELPGYERERSEVIKNTEALLRGLPANNVLLYGDAGTGKSSTIKAIANEYRDQGLRLIEVRKNQLYQIPEIMDSLAANPLKFILFIDDLSFSSNDDNFAALKAILEGSVGGRAGNICVYATSNRRHLIKETLSDREGDDIHEMDTRQELMSLSARFGLVVTFQRPDKDRFTHIIEELSRQQEIEEDLEKLMIRAEAFAIRAGGRSPRAARQFIELVKSGVR